MSIAISQSELTAALLAPVRAAGRIRLVYENRDGLTHARETGEGGGFRARFPRSENMAETVLINTGGGLTGGDQAKFDIAMETSAAALITTQSAEKIYRSNGPDTQVAVMLSLHARSALHWLPQETILFCGARLRRRLDVAMAGDASLLIAETVVYGRRASGEILADGLFSDQWRIRRDGRLIFAEATMLDGPIDALLARPALGAGARATATILLVAPGAESRLEEARALLADAACAIGASAWNGVLVVRLLASTPDVLRAAKRKFLTMFRGEALPRLWEATKTQ